MARCKECGAPLLARDVSDYCVGCRSSVRQPEKVPVEAWKDVAEKVIPRHEKLKANRPADWEPSEFCPTCGKRLKPLSNAERQRRWRAKQK